MLTCKRAIASGCGDIIIKIKLSLLSHLATCGVSHPILSILQILDACSLEEAYFYIIYRCLEQGSPVPMCHTILGWMQVIIVDEFTGRTMPGRRWGDGLHQAVEAKERVPIQNETVTLASITYQVCYPPIRAQGTLDNVPHDLNHNR